MEHDNLKNRKFKLLDLWVLEHFGTFWNIINVSFILRIESWNYIYNNNNNNRTFNI